MNDKDFEELAQGLFGLDAETLQARLTEDDSTEDEKHEFAFKFADKVLKSAGFERTLLVARDGEEFGFFMPGNHIAASHLILSALEYAPKGTLEHVLLHLNSEKVKECLKN